MKRGELDLGSVPLSPSWVIVGIDVDRQRFVETGQAAGVDAGVMLYASTKLTEGELRARTTMPDLFDRDTQNRYRFDVSYSLTVEMGQFVVVVAPTYEEALARLFRQWQPEQTKAIEAT